MMLGDERHCFLVVEESLGTETVSEYRRVRTKARRPSSWPRWFRDGERSLSLGRRPRHVEVGTTPTSR
jgi:hypothetical protein